MHSTTVLKVVIVQQASSLLAPHADSNFLLHVLFDIIVTILLTVAEQRKGQPLR